MRKLFMLGTLIFLVVAAAHSQRTTISKGHYSLDSLSIVNLVPGDTALTPETCTWRDYYHQARTLEITGDMQMKFTKDGADRTARLELSGDELKVIFSDPNDRTSYTIYNYISLGNSFIVSREDEMVRETYLFSNH